MDTIRVQHIPVTEFDISESMVMILKSCNTIQKWRKIPNRTMENSILHIRCASPVQRSRKWRIGLALNTGGLPEDNNQESIKNEGPGRGGTRLGRIVSAGGRELLQKLNSARQNFPMKIFLLLFGFYTANALATILGQTGDWDVLVAGVVVAAIEGIGMLMYKKLPSMTKGRFQSLVVMINYWKAGVCLGLFVDAFKVNIVADRRCSSELEYQEFGSGSRFSIVFASGELQEEMFGYTLVCAWKFEALVPFSFCACIIH
ncbi:hypothetical protein LIER_04911 [Lithospermum erythrorhizon]|uniref:Ycf20-like protein n=1 Tax=Lithospermum erythrorhizon TaxID=34254 RepID=A0AAV3P383_LITER